MRRMASPAALSRTLSLQRANARAKSSRAESFNSDQITGNTSSQLSKRIDILFTSISSTNNIVADSCNIDYTQSKPVIEPSNQIALPVINAGSNHHAMKRSFSADIPTGYKACFSSLSERIDRGIDLWDRDFSSMSSYASEHDGFLCGLIRLHCDSNILCEPAKGKEDACSKISSWSEDSFVDAIQIEDHVASSNANYRLQGFGIADCTRGSHSYVANQNLQRGVCGDSLQASDKHTLMQLLPQYSADYEGAKTVYKARTAGDLEEYLSSRGGHVTESLQVGGASCTHSLQEASARDGDEYEEIKLSMSEGQSNTKDGSRKSEADHEEEEVIISRIKEDDNSLHRMKVRSKRDYDRLEEEIRSSKRDYESVEEEMIGSCSKGDKDSSCRKREEGYSNKEEEMQAKSVEERGAFNLPADSVAVEMVSVNVVEDFRESMYEMMMMEKHMEEEDTCMQHLLNCYLLLNPPHLHGLIREVFSDVWIDIIMTLR